MSQTLPTFTTRQLSWLKLVFPGQGQSQAWVQIPVWCALKCARQNQGRLNKENVICQDRLSEWVHCDDMIHLSWLRGQLTHRSMVVCRLGLVAKEEIFLLIWDSLQCYSR